MSEAEATPLGDVLGEAAEAAQPEPVTETPETTPEPEQTEQQDSPPESETVPLAAVKDERSKRQAAEETSRNLERQLAEMQGQLKVLNQQNQPPEQEAPELDEERFFADPVGELKRIQDLAKSSAQEATKAAQNSVLTARLQQSEIGMRRYKEDFMEKKAHFQEMALKDNTLVVKMLQEPDPWEFAYQEAEKDMTFSQTGNMDDLKASIREELKAEVLAEVKQELAEQGQKLDNLPPSSLAKEPSKGSVQGSEWSGPTSLDNLLK